MGFQTTTFAPPAEADSAPAACTAAALQDALLDRTVLATDRGWQAVQTLAKGDWVLDAEGRFRQIRGIERQTLWAAQGFARRHWPLRIPPGLFDNTTVMFLLPDQKLRLGRPEILAEAWRFEGLEGVTAQAPGAALAVTRLRFARPTLVLAHHGAVLQCPGPAPVAETPQPTPLGLDVVTMRP